MGEIENGAPEIIRGGQEIHDQNPRAGGEKIKIDAPDANELMLEPNSLHTKESKINVQPIEAGQVIAEEPGKKLHEANSGSTKIGEIDPNLILTETQENNPEHYKAA